jgi:tRNA threonylcarbamoyladenosine biosynthesis protein TsaE
LGQPLIRRAALPDEKATADLARQLVERLPAAPAGWLIALQGELGAGKSTFARAMIREYGHRGPVPSPTYTLVEPYELSGFSLYHIDLYRISSADELEFLGWSDLADGLRLVEWPERVPGLVDEADVHITLTYAGAGRSAELAGLTSRGADTLRRMDLK